MAHLPDLRERLSGRPGFLVVLVGALYFAQGLPLGVAFGAYAAILRDGGAALSLLAWVPLLGLPWVLKFLWSPLVDNRWSARLGRRRTWLLSQQVLMIASVGALAAFPVTAASAPIHFALLGLASLFSATQDIATDGLAAERLAGRDLVRANGLSVGGMIAGTLVGGGGLLMVAGWVGTTAGLLLIAALLAACLVPTLLWREGGGDMARATAPRASLAAAIGRPRFWLLLALAVLFAASHSADAALARLYLVDGGWSLGDLGLLETLASLSMLLLGCGGATWLLSKLGVWRCLLLALALLLATTAAWLAVVLSAEVPGVGVPGFAAVAAIRLTAAAGLGMATVAVFTAIMLFASRGRQTGTDVTILKSANVLGEIAFASAATGLAGQAGYAWAFGLTLAVGLAALGVARRALRRGESLPDRATAMPS